MHIPWSDPRCIICHMERPLSTEHLIPEALGGNLTCDFLCRPCNSRLGATFEAAARNDPSIRISAQKLQESIPNLADKLRENQDFFVDGPDGRNRGRIRTGDFRIRARKATDGSLVQPTDIARTSIANMMRKSGSSEASITEALRMLDRAPEGHRVMVSSNLEAVKWAVDKIQLDLSGNRLMSPLVPVKIAFEFLACHLGTAIYQEIPPIEAIRNALLTLDAGSASFRVERLNASDYQPFHGIYFEGNDPHAKVLMQLLGWLAFRVHFPQLQVGGDRYRYTHYLESGEEDFRRIESGCSPIA